VEVAADADWVSCASPDRKISLDPTMVSSCGWLKLYVKFVSTLNSR